MTKQKYFLCIALALTSFQIRAQNADFNSILIQGGDPDKVAIQKDPGPDAEELVELIHEKNILISSDNYTSKWTTLGYGQMTHKVLIPELAKHTIFNHRNDGEDGPCLSSQQILMQPTNTDSISGNEDIEIKIKIQNQYRINRAEKICEVTLIEDVRTLIGTEEFSHTYKKPMGYRFIEDCL